MSLLFGCDIPVSGLSGSLFLELSLWDLAASFLRMQICWNKRRHLQLVDVFSVECVFHERMRPSLQTSVRQMLLSEYRQSSTGSVCCSYCHMRLDATVLKHNKNKTILSELSENPDTSKEKWWKRIGFFIEEVET